MSHTNRPKDIVDAIEELAAQSGAFEPVDENYYQAFLDLTQQQIEKLAVAVILDQEKEVRRLARGRSNPAAVASVSRLVRNVFTGISVGLARFDAFGRLGFVARIGFDPTAEMNDALEHKFQLIEPMITNIVRRTLPWLLSREVSQGELPL
ncbi:MAG: hypothetical protein KDN22_34320 [Verrucomicrobiae bacterium]|nr:hypothetical protein [Verrucomicrobiae bacterium]